MNTKTPYKRVLLKLSGEALLGKKSFGIDPDVLRFLTKEIAEVQDLGIEMAIVIGAGNIWRGAKEVENGIERVPSDYMGMLATIMNAVALQSALERETFETRVCSALNIPSVAESYIKRRAERHLEKGRIVICAAGTGNPYFTTDSAATLRGLELSCDVVLKATRVDGVYSADPEKDVSATRYSSVSFAEVLEKGLRVMDGTAIAQCRDNDLPIIVFKIMEKGNLRKILMGEDIGTKIVSNVD